MNLKDIKTLSEISKEKGISVKTLYKKTNRLIEDGKLKEFQHYKKLGEGKQPYIFNKKGK